MQNIRSFFWRENKCYQFIYIGISQHTLTEYWLIESGNYQITTERESERDKRITVCKMIQQTQ